MPPVSEKQRRAMYAAAEGKSTLGIPKAVGEEFVGKVRGDDGEPPTELTVAKAIRDGELGSPQRYENVWLFAVRITGTGTAYRKALDEYVYRPPEHFLTPEFVERCNGLPVIFLHPGNQILNTQEYRDRAVGTVMLPYIQEDEVWGIAKIFDADAAELMQSTHASTSPAVVFRDAGSTESLEIDGESVLIEGKPSYLDHLAICEEGVWDKGGEPSGVQLNEVNTVEEEKAPAWADALHKKLDSVCKRIDALEGKGRVEDGKSKNEDEAKRDDEHEGFKKLEHEIEGEGKSKESAEKIAAAAGREKYGEKGMEEKAAAGRKDSEDGSRELGKREEAGEKRAEKEIRAAEKESNEERRKEREEGEKRSDAQMNADNADVRRKLAALENRLADLSKPLSVDTRKQLSEAQSRADSVFQLFGEHAPAPMHGENPVAYRKRLAASLQKHSKSLKSLRLDSVDGEAFGVIENQIYSDAQAAAAEPANLPPGRLIPIVRQDSAGRMITSYTGDIDAWLGVFKGVGQVARINRNPSEAR